MSEYYARTMTFAEFKTAEGTEIGISRWVDVGQDRIDGFAEVTEDHFFIHTDPTRAADETPFGGAIAHGFLTAALLAPMAYDALPGLEGSTQSVNYGFDKLRFVAPVPAGARVRGRFTLVEADDGKPGEVTLRIAATIEIEGGSRPALVADWLIRHFRDGA